MSDELTRIPEEISIPTTTDNRLLVRTWENANGTKLVTITPQYLGRGHEWKLAHSGLVFTASVARALAPAITMMAATIDGAPEDPTPTEEDRCESRWP